MGVSRETPDVTTKQTCYDLTDIQYVGIHDTSFLMIHVLVVVLPQLGALTNIASNYVWKQSITNNKAQTNKDKGPYEYWYDKTQHDMARRGTECPGAQRTSLSREHAYTHIHMHVCMYVRTYVRTYVGRYIHVYTYIYIYIIKHH